MPNGPSTDFLAPFVGAGFRLPQGSGPGLLWGWGWEFQMTPAMFGTGRFNAIHMALIPKGPHQGKVVVWNRWPVLVKPKDSLDPTNFWVCQAWAIVDPYTTQPTSPSSPRFRNFLLPMMSLAPAPNGEPPTAGTIGDLFCCGQAWSQRGELVVAGGAQFQYDLTQNPIGYLETGARWLFVFDPAAASQPFLTAPSLYPGDVGAWEDSRVFFLQLHTDRYYPTVTMSCPLGRLLGDQVAMVSGGTDPNAAIDPQNTYESWIVHQSTSSLLFATDSNPDQPGPGTMGPLEVDWLQEYPRQFSLSDGSIISTGPAYNSAKINLDANLGGSWDTTVGQGGTNWTGNREDGSNVFFAKMGSLRDVVVRVCGQNALGIRTDKAEMLLATTPPTPPNPSSAWAPLYQGADQVPPRPRVHTNALILPDASILVLGGIDNNGAAVSELALFQITQGWTQLPAGANSPTIRDYHATAVLLPDGRVFVGGGEGRLGGTDYDIFSPHYLQGSPLRPVITGIDGATFSEGAWRLSYGSQVYGLQVAGSSLKELDSLAKVVMIAPGAITHHSDMSARYVELTSQAVPGKPHARDFVLPDNKTLLPGDHMLFALNTKDIPSVAAWVLVQ